MRKNKSTFNEILIQTQTQNSERLMQKARCANRIAKTLRGHRKQVVYRVKHKALSSLVEYFPKKVTIRKDVRLPDFVVIELENSPSGLHFPVAGLN